MTHLATLHQTDGAQWTQRNAELLCAGRFEELDIEHLLEERGFSIHRVGLWLNQPCLRSAPPPN